eukprot:Sspe_Gene.34091::Locus_16585_Transcript_1_1_Confidence_1.000_Length_1630::g.34091::m.34091/K12844/PRPF31; U4/U6 small nuclear ribonucleoprotein PRP31
MDLDDLDNLLEDVDDVLDDVDDEADEQGEINELDDMLKYDDVKEVAKILRSERMHSHLAAIEEAGDKEGEGVLLVDDPEYQLLLESNKLVVDIDKDIAKVHKFIRDHYAIRFPELEGFIFDPIVYAKVVQCIGNTMDVTLVTNKLQEIVPQHTIMIIQTTGSTTQGKKLSQEELERVLEACEEMFGLEEAKQLVLEFVQSRMNRLTPNLSAIVGTAIASQLVGIAGGVQALSKLPSNIVRTLGKSKKSLGGFAATTQLYHTGFLLHCDIVKSQPSDWRRKVANLVASKVTLAIRCDADRSTPDGSYGTFLREEILKKIAKWKEPPPAKQKKALPAPKEGRKSRRAGKKYQRMRQKWKQTEVSKHMNRMNFGEVEEEDFMEGRNYGNLKKEMGKIRITAETKVKAKKPKNEPKVSRDGLQSGLASSLVFTPVQGMELVPNKGKEAVREDGSKYFSMTKGFRTAASGNASFLGSTAAGSTVASALGNQK